MMRMRRWVSLLIVIAALALSDPSLAFPCRGGCREPGLCTATGGCAPLPISLPVASGPISDLGYSADGSQCGVKRCYLMFTCACGQRFGLNICDDSGCDPTEFPPDCT